MAGSTAGRKLRGWGRLIVVAFYAVAMAWVESACVVYLRTLLHRVDPYQATPIPIADFPVAAELLREAATLVMLASTGWLAGRSWRGRFGAGIFAFGIWDIFYYVFLRIIVGWPRTLFDWDVLFLLPLPWWGPVLTPMLISVLLILLGGVMTLHDLKKTALRSDRAGWAAFGGGIILALYAFMESSIVALMKGGERIGSQLPTRFNWLIFILSLALMSAPLLGMFKTQPAGYAESGSRNA